MDLLTDATPLDAEALQASGSGIARVADRWTDLVRRDRAERDAVLLFGNERYDAWLIGWPPGHSTTPHDHGESLGFFVVIDGQLVERSSELGRSTVRVLRPGDHRLIPVAGVHDVGTGDQTALSVHVYSPPLREMNFFTKMPLGA